jgi:hypothetical protein
MRPAIITLFIIATALPLARAQTSHVLGIEGTAFTLDGQPFYYTGVSFFNAIYNPTLNANDASRRMWLGKLKASGINVIRVWAQWDCGRGFADGCPTCSLYEKDGKLRAQHLSTLKKLVSSANDLEMVVLLTVFSRESWEENIRLSDEQSDQAVRTLTQELKPYRNMAFEVWNEFDHRSIDYLKIIKSVDAERLVTNSPGYGGYLGRGDENNAMDFLSPHTSRRDDLQWEISPKEIAYLLQLYQKPVVDDEPARKGTPKYGGPNKPTTPYDHILRIYNVWKAGGYVIYHHDMFQTGYGSDAVPPSGIPDPDFSPYHKIVFDFLAHKERYLTPLK